ncbi:hypothetical protein ACQ4PT_008838 [Festuca glaucescens]
MKKDMSVLQLISYVLFLGIMLVRPTTSATGATLRADLTHVDSGRSFTNLELLRRLTARSTAQAARFGVSTQAATVPVARGTTGNLEVDSEYLIHFGIGTPSPQAVALTLDTGSDLIWTQCACTNTTCFEQPFPVFDPSASGTIGAVSCSDPICTAQGGLPDNGCSAQDNLCLYAYTYADKSITQGTIIQDTFTFSDVAVPSLRFGCGTNNSGIFTSEESGIAGFGRGPLSLPSQLNISMFSYCFTTIVESARSPVFLGTPDNLGANAQSTPFIPSSSSHYYLPLQGITVGETLLPLDASVFAIKNDGSGGTIIDSGTGITRFPQAVFQSLQEAFVSQVSLPVANASDTGGLLCFSTPQAADPKSVSVPKLIFHLDGADWDLPRESYVLDVENDGNGGALLCVVIFSAGENGMTIIGNFQQQNTHIVYDLEANKMVFAPASCDKL